MLFRPDVGIAAGAARGRDHRHVAAAIGGGRPHRRIDAGGRTQHTVGFRQFVAERFLALACGSAPRRDVSLRR